MSKMRLMTFLAGYVLALCWPGGAAAQLVDTPAEHAVILDHETGDVLYAKNATAGMIPASMTKMMTVQVVFERLKSGELSLSDRFTVSETAWKRGGWASGGSTMGLAIGDQPTVEELLYGVIVLSGNDACIVLAEGISGSEAAFADEMTRRAREMGLESATFRNSTGLYAEDHRISAIDLARLARQQITEFPAYYELYAETDYEWRDISQPNRNPLLGRMAAVDGLKTGHLEASGYGLTASGVNDDGQRRIMVINGLESEGARAREGERLMRIALNAFETRTLTPDTTDLPALDVWMGARSKLNVTLGETARVSGHKRAFPRARTELVYDGPLEAPITKGEQVARLVIQMDGQGAATSVPVLAAESVARLGFLGRVLEGLRRKIEGAPDQPRNGLDAA